MKSVHVVIYVFCLVLIPSPAFSEQLCECVGQFGRSRYVDVTEDCWPFETKLCWNIEGPQGIEGPIGPAGPQGPAGAFDTSKTYTVRCFGAEVCACERFDHIILNAAIRCDHNYPFGYFTYIEKSEYGFGAGGGILYEWHAICSAYQLPTAEDEVLVHVIPFPPEVTTIVCYDPN